MRTLVKNDKRRCNILGIAVPDYRKQGELVAVNITREQLEALLHENLIDPDEQQNDSPTVKDFLEFLKRNPSFYAIGYIISPNRPDYRISIDGVEAKSCTKAELVNFRKIFRKADLYIEKPPHAWYD
jgi:hypothetical protein